MAQAPGKNFRKGLTIIDLMEMFPTEESAREWFESTIWPDGRKCPYCKGDNTCESTHKKMPYWCTDCRMYFSAKKGTVMQGSPLPYRKWVLAIYLHMTSLKGVSSMKLHRDIGVTQKTAWFMLNRIREAFKRDDDDEPPMGGPVEVDETFVGGTVRNQSNAKRKARKEAGVGSGTTDMTIVLGAKCRESNEVRAEVVDARDKVTLQGFIADHAATDAKVYTDDHGAYAGMPFDHETVNHSAAEYVRDMAHTNGIESFWAVLKRAHKGVYHKFSVKHLQRYVTDFAGRHNVRTKDTLTQMEFIVAGMVGKRLTYKALKADNGLASGARSGVKSG
ncbi:MAG: IS1595 family transposase [Boseongicola sp. SB0677_bin_26]|nr:IS1595 family transposase [Boseongicola sp. SB0665_bin_10]MYG26718.1 IS1595 family transposase [Boseongicola sp. SB0677_bin_26]